MSSTLRFTRPLPGTLRASAALIGVVLVAGLVAQAIGGTTASITVGLAAGSAMAYGTVMPTRVAAVVTLVGGAAAALGAAVSGDPWLSGLAVAAMVLVTAPASAYSAGALMLAPLLTMVFAVVDRGWPWWQAGIWGVVGGLVGLLITAILRFGKKAPTRLPWGWPGAMRSSSRSPRARASSWPSPSRSVMGTGWPPPSSWHCAHCRASGPATSSSGTGGPSSARSSRS